MAKHNKYYYDVDRNINPNVSTTANINPKMLISKHQLKFEWHLEKTVEKVVNLLKEKNKAYGDTALNPAGIFSKLDSTEALCARIDDKLSRIKNKGITDNTEDTVNDLIGYLLLLKMSIENKNRKD